MILEGYYRYYVLYYRKKKTHARVHVTMQLIQHVYCVRTRIDLSIVPRTLFTLTSRQRTKVCVIVVSSVPISDPMSDNNTGEYRVVMRVRQTEYCYRAIRQSFNDCCVITIIRSIVLWVYTADYKRVYIFNYSKQT